MNKIGVKKLFLSVAIVLMVCGTIFAKPLTLNQISEATCRATFSSGKILSNGQQEFSCGTGTCVYKDSNYYYVLTSAHVVGDASSGKVEFFKRGRKTTELLAEVVWKTLIDDYDYDFAILRIKKDAFGKYPPRTIPLVPKGYSVKSGDYIASVGCPMGRWANGWEGHANYSMKEKVVFLPAPVSGQSGSGIIVLLKGKDGKWHSRVGAIATWRIEEQGFKPMGGAIQINTLYSAMAGLQPMNRVPSTHKRVVYKRISYKLALGADNNLYKIDYRNGIEVISFGSSLPVNIVNMDYCSSYTYNGPYSMSGEHGKDYSDVWRSRPQPKSPSKPFPQTPAPVPATPGNPYGVVPPSIGGEWPGIEEKEEEKEEESKTDEEELRGLAKDYLKVQEEKKALEEKIIALDDKIKEDAKAKAEAEAKAKAEAEAKAKAETEEKPVGFFAKMKGYVNGWLGGLLASAGVVVLLIVWKKFVRPRLTKNIDSIQDYIQEKVSEKYGPEYGKEIRDVLEGLEEAIFGVADAYVEEVEAKRKVTKAAAKGKMAEKVEEGNPIKKQPTSAEILEAVKLASKEVGDDAVTTEVPKRVNEIINRVLKDKGTSPPNPPKSTK